MNERIEALGKPMPLAGDDKKPDARGRFAILYALNAYARRAST